MHRGKVAVVIGGTSGIGLRVAEKIVEGGGGVHVGGRDAERVRNAVEKLGATASGAVVDNRDQASLAAFFAGIDRLDYLFTPGASYSIGRIDQASDEVAESSFKSKFWGQYYAVKHALPKLSQNGAIVLMSGAYSVRPYAAGAAYGACNAAIEGLGRALATELAPIRVNVVSPGTIDSDLWRNRPKELREMAFKAHENTTLLRRVGTTEEVADVVEFLLTNGYMTGSTLYPDGGYALR